MSQQRFKKGKKPNKMRLFILLLLLVVITYLWMHSESIISSLFNSK